MTHLPALTCQKITKTLSYIYYEACNVHKDIEILSLTKTLSDEALARYSISRSQKPSEYECKTRTNKSLAN